MSQSDRRNRKPSHQGRLVLDDKAVKKEMQGIPEEKRGQFLTSLEMARLGLPPALRHQKLTSAGDGVIELKINGSPAYRCMYVVTKGGDVVVLHVTSKTTQGQDQQLIKTTTLRRKRLVPAK